jgi:ketosteroid isomerase-like protein
MSEMETSEIRKLVEDRSEAIRSRDDERSTYMMAADYLLFDVVDPLQSKGAGSARNRAKEWFATFQGPLGTRFKSYRSVPPMALVSATA